MPDPAAHPEDPLRRYSAKRNFAITPEPKAVREDAADRSFVIQKHWASRLHYDFRLELDGVLLSWAVPKGPSLDPKDKRLAIHVEDHPVSYGGFEGTIPARQYGAGEVIVWDRGHWDPVGDPRAGMAAGKLVFMLHGEKLAGLWELVRTSKADARQEQWLLFKKRDEWARPVADYDVISALPDSVIGEPLGLLEEREPRAHGTARAGAARPGSSPAEAAGPISAQAASARRISAPELPGAAKAALPAGFSPQLATLAKGVPGAGEWSYELKLDGYRLLARIRQGKVRFFTRNGNDWTDKLPTLKAAVETLGIRSAWLDGEIVVFDDTATPDFNALQNSFDAARTDDIVYFLFDVPYFEGYDLRPVQLHLRRALLRQILEAHDSGPLRFSADFMADPADILRSACQMRLEGIIAKRVDAPYVSQRTGTWLKLKCSERQEFVIAGFTDRTGASDEVGSIVLGYHDDSGRLRSAGSVGTGWNSTTGAQLHLRLAKLVVPDTPFAVLPKAGRWSTRSAGTEHWVKPQLVAEVSFSEWTPDGHIRHASFVGLRTDKPASAITREAAAVTPGAKPRRPSGGKVGTVKVSNPERVIDPSTGLKKLDLVRYYEGIAEWMLPHLKGRPVSLVRGPGGVGGQLFFQKHDDKLSIPGMRALDPALWPGHGALLEVPTKNALVSAAQMNVIEFHTWNSTAKSLDKPDRMVFDLDPGEGVKWPQTREAALLTRTLLAELGLQSWLKTSGGKGLHVVVPLAPRRDYETVKGFSQAVVQHLAQTIPSRFVARSGPANRVGKVFADYLRNGQGATTVAAFSARARPGLGVSMPVSWDELSELRSGSQWTIATAREYLSFRKRDPWADFGSSRQTLTSAMKTLGYKPKASLSQ